MAISQDRLAELGAFNAEMLEALAAVPRAFLVNDLISQASVNLAVGDSGLGKTPFFVQLGLAVVGGIPFCGLATTPGPVLYFDCESPPDTFLGIVKRISRFIGHPHVPADFICFNPQWDPRTTDEQDILLSLTQLVEEIRPALVIVDPLRVVWPRAEVKSEDAVEMVRFQRKLSRAVGCSWVNVHHCRKPSTENPNPPSLIKNPYEWLLESAGSRALVNQTDSRLGFVRGDDIVMSGFVRMIGQIPPRTFRRAFDTATGDPIAYELVSGLDAVNDVQRAFWTRLPLRFGFNEAFDLYRRDHEGKGSRETVSKYLKALEVAGLVVGDGEKGYKKGGSAYGSESYASTVGGRTGGVP